MVIKRTTNTLVDGTKRRIAYYACGNWKNKVAAVCTSNSIRVENTNEYVFGKISELLTNENMVKAIVNKERVRKVNPTKKELEKLEKELEQLDKKKNKLFDAYEEEILSNEEFKERKEMLNKRTQELLEQKQPLLETLEDTVTDEIPYKYLKSILANFSKILSESTSREQQKKLYQMQSNYGKM